MASRCRHGLGGGCAKPGLDCRIFIEVRWMNLLETDVLRYRQSSAAYEMAQVMLVVKQ